jgi:stage IV sporulation protein FB
LNFSFLRIPVQIQPSFWLLLLFFSNLYREFSVDNLIFAGIFFFSLLIHEYGHALTALYFGAKPWIVLEGLGGKAYYNDFKISDKERFIVTLNGPLLESLLVVVPYALLNLGLFSSFPLIESILTLTMKINFLWCVFNLLPVAPLDGGYLLQYLLEKKWGDLGTKVSQWIGILAASSGATWLFCQGSFFFGTLLLLFGWNYFQELRRDWRLPKRSNFRCHMKAAKAIQDHKLDEAKSLLKKLLKVQSPSMKYSAVESLAKIYLEEGKSQKAYDLLINADPAFLKEGKCLLCRLAFERGNYKLIAEYAQEIYAIEPSYEIAVLNARAFAHLEERELSEAWFATAAQFETPALK